MFLDKLYCTVPSLMSNAVDIGYRIPKMDPAEDPAVTTVLFQLVPGGNQVVNIGSWCETFNIKINLKTL